MKEKGVYETEVDGKIIGFRFGTYAGSITEEIAGCSLSNVFISMAEGKGAMKNILHYFYGGAVDYSERKGQQKPSLRDVGDMIDSIGFEKAKEIMKESMAGYSKNEPAPQTEGQKITE